MDENNRSKPFYTLFKNWKDKFAGISGTVFKLVYAGILLENHVAELERRIEKLENRS